MNATDDKIRTMLRELDRATPRPPSFDDLHCTARLGHLDLDPPSRPGRLVAMAVAGAVIVVGLGGLLVTLDGRDRQPTPVPPAAVPPAPPTPVALVVELADELRLPHPGVLAVRDEPSIFQRRVYGAADDPGDPSRMIGLEYANALSMVIPCHTMMSLVQPGGGAPDPGEGPTGDEWADAAAPIDGARPFDVADTTAYTCVQHGVLSAGWYTSGIGVVLNAGPAVERDELIEVARSLRAVEPAMIAQGTPPVDLVADPLPTGWIALVHEDVPFVQRITETGWSATVGGNDGSSSQLLVHTWTNVDEQGAYAKMPPIQAERITVRGHEGYRYVSEQRGERGPLQLEVWWTEQPGMVVYVWSTNLYEVDELMELIDQMVPVDEARYAAFQRDGTL